MKQRNIPWLGAVAESVYNALPVLSIINFVSIVVVLYTNVNSYLAEWAPWLSFWLFLGAMVGIVAIVVLVMYLIVVPSIWTFRNKQMNSFESDVLEEIRALRAEIKQIKGEGQ